MSTRIKKIARNILFMLSIPVIIGAFVFANVSTRDEVCGGVQIAIARNELSFVNQEDIQKKIAENGVMVNKTKLRTINISRLEKSIAENAWVSKVNIYVSAGNVLHIYVEQKKPFVRIQPVEETESPYYLDEYANTIPFSTKYIPQLPVVTTPELGFTTADIKVKSGLVTLAKYISKDTFWDAVITQINLDTLNQLELIPAIGSQKIILGSIDNLESKMNKLFLLYRQGYYTVSWDQYDEIDLRFEKQVICRNTRGQKLSVDPYDKTTPRPAVTPVPATVIVDVAKANNNTAPKVEPVKKVVTVAAKIDPVEKKPAVLKPKNPTDKVVAKSATKTITKPAAPKAKPAELPQENHHTISN